MMDLSDVGDVSSSFFGLLLPLSSSSLSLSLFLLAIASRSADGHQRMDVSALGNRSLTEHAVSVTSHATSYLIIDKVSPLKSMQF